MLLLLCWLAFGGSPQSARADAKSVAAGIEAKYARARTLQAQFYETYRAGGAGGQAESGTVYFAKPGRMRWEYESPETKLFIVDGKSVWFYVPADHTASRAAMKESEDWRTPLALLTGRIHLDRLCGRMELLDDASGTVAPGDLPYDPRNRVLSCLPHKVSDPTAQPPFREILFEVSPDFELARVLIREAGDVQTEFRFANWRENLVVAESKFHFEPPPGVAIVNEEGLAQAAH
jgi:outer membrane lipoprotein carrier protein